MIVLFVNLHSTSQEGQAKFKRYYNSVTSILKQTIYIGNNYEEQIRTKEILEDFVYDEVELNGEQRAVQKFQSVSYVFIDGPLNIPPWSSSIRHVFLLIRNSLRKNKKVHFNGFGHIAAYYYISTGFERPVLIKKLGQEKNGKEDYFHEQETGDLYAFGKKVCNSGVRVEKTSQNFHSKSTQALKKGTVILPTKFHKIAFDSKNGGKLLDTIKFPFTFFQKSKVTCTSLRDTRANIKALVETEEKSPIVFTYKNSLSTHLICPQTLKILSNWICEGEQIKVKRNVKLEQTNKDEIGFNNTLLTKSKGWQRNMQTINTYSNIHTHKHPKSYTGFSSSRPNSAYSKKKFDFQKPSVRCSGPYETLDHLFLMEEAENKTKMLGKSRMIFKPDAESLDIKNYVQRTPSRPPSAHNFRQVNKAKWMDKKTFFVT